MLPATQWRLRTNFAFGIHHSERHFTFMRVERNRK
jgi:hypothetical protein